jgi:DNA-binding MarR family transcriptional regulator
MYLQYMYIHTIMTPRKQSPGKSLVADARLVTRTCAGLNVRLAARLITQFLEVRMQAANLSLAQFGLMSHIAAAGDDTIGSLAGRAGLDQSTLSRNLRSLEQAGLVEIAIVEQDLRRRAVWLTEKGARRLEAAIPIWERAHRALFDLIGPSNLRRMGAITQALAEAGEAAHTAGE